MNELEHLIAELHAEILTLEQVRDLEALKTARLRGCWRTSERRCAKLEFAFCRISDALKEAVEPPDPI